MGIDTVTIKACVEGDGNSLFPSDTNIITHNGKPLRDELLSMNNTIPEFIENTDGSIKLIFDDGK